MASISLGPIVDGIRGSIGGVTFSSTQSGATARSRPRTMHPRRELQLAGQKYMGEAAASWRGEAPVDQEGWATWAASVELTNSLGQVYHPTPMQAYVWSYNFQRWSEHTLDMTPPSELGLPPTPTLTYTYQGHDVTFVTFVPEPEEPWWCWILLYYPDRRRAWNRMRRYGRSIVSHETATPINIFEGVDTQFAEGTLLRLHLPWRFRDGFGRVSTRQMQHLDIEVAAPE